MGNTLDSNTTGLRIAEEVVGTPGTLPATPIWVPYEPNSYGEFGATTSTVARSPIAPDRQNRKGSVTGVEAVAGFQSDFTAKGLDSLMQGFMFATWRDKDLLKVTAVTATGYTVASGGAVFPSGVLLHASGFTTSANNGLKVAGTSTATSVLAPGLTVEAATTNGEVRRVGRQFPADGLTLSLVNGTMAMITATAGGMNNLGIVPGEWIWVGGDDAATGFANEKNNGFYRVRYMDNNNLTCDRSPSGWAPDTGAGKTIQLFLGSYIKNEADPALQVKRTYQAERILNSTNIQYVKAIAANTLAIDVKSNDKITVDLGFVGLDEEQLTAPKPGTRPGLPTNNVAFSSATDFTRLRLLNDAAGNDLATYMTDLKLSIDNGVTQVNAIGSVGGIDLNTGNFTVAGSVEAFFSTIAACQAVRANADVALDFALIADAGGTATGYLFDVPLISLGDGRVKVEKDTPIKLPLTMDAVAHSGLNHTLSVGRFHYLPRKAL